MAVPEAQGELILAALRSQIEAQMTGDPATHYAVDVVVRPATWAQFDAEFFDKRYTTIVMLRPGNETIEESAAEQLDCELEFFVLVTTNFKLDSPNPFAEAENDPIYQKVQQRLKRDVLKAIFADVTLGGTADNARITDTDMGGEYVEDWCTVELRGLITYNSLRTSP